MGNRRSVEKALRAHRGSVSVTNDHERLRAAAGLVVPGVGAFPARDGQPARAGPRRAAARAYGRRHPGLGHLPRHAARLRALHRAGRHPGPGRDRRRGARARAWLAEAAAHRLERGEPRRRLAADRGLPERCAFYHVHSFAPVPSAAEDILGTAVYGAPFASVVAHESFYGVQFHPEKSSAAGLRLLANFGRICARASVPVGS